MRKEFVLLSVEEMEDIRLARDKGKGIQEISIILTRGSSEDQSIFCRTS
jgi:hypothetical protein